jgi:hypothetical protein
LLYQEFKMLLYLILLLYVSQFMDKSCSVMDSSLANK